MVEEATIKNAILNGLYAQRYPGQRLLGPSLVTNRTGNIWTSLRYELTTCKSFTWAVAFLTLDMLTPLKVVLADLAAQGIRGTLYTSDYLGFNSPQVFRELLKIPNLTVRLVQVTGFHTKGYFFEHDEYTTALIGSANFTRSALLTNDETMLRVSSTQDGRLLKQVNDNLQQLKGKSVPLTAKWIAAYQKTWQPPVTPSKSEQGKTRVVPNQMQRAALKELQALLDHHAKRGLVISATGTGKTYLGAFAVKAARPQKFLYLVHREQIAQKSLASFRRVIGGPQSDYGLVSGDRRDFSAKYIFATVQTLSQPTVLGKLSPQMFDYILIDEAHRAAAPSYQRVMGHFRPAFWLGMTATPERMDNQDVFKLFDYHVAYEIRLRDALDANMLAPFHYVGVQDYETDGETIDETTKLSRLVAPERVKYVLQQLKYYGYCGPQPRGLVFCSRQKEARELARQFTAAGHPAVALTNQEHNRERQRAVSRLEDGELEYIVTVDLFNEGVDIPSLNQIVMLRNTQSQIVFTQQLGRGLRKYPRKKFVTVIDFIGNYKHNYMIPLALNGDASRDQDRARQEVQLPPTLGVSTISFTRIARERILTSLERTKLDSMATLRQAFHELRDRLGRVPLLADFLRLGTVSPVVFAHNKKLANYGSFLRKMSERVSLNNYQEQVLTFVTKELLDGKRAHELVLLKLLVTAQTHSCSQAALIAVLQDEGCYANQELLRSLDDILSLRFYDVKAGKQTKKASYGNQAVVERTSAGGYRLNDKISEGLSENSQFADLLMDTLHVGLALSKNYDQTRQFTLYQRYDRKDVCRLLNWPLDVSAPMYGYRVGERECPIFITYQKRSAKKRNAIYDNQLQDGELLRWYTRSPRHLDSPEVQRLLAGVSDNQPRVKLYLFVKQSDAVGKQFYYLGTAKIVSSSVREEQLGIKKKAAVGMDLLLETPLTTAMAARIFN